MEVPSETNRLSDCALLPNVSHSLSLECGKEGEDPAFPPHPSLLH